MTRPGRIPFLGSARGSRALLGGPPKTSYGKDYMKRGKKPIPRHIEKQSFDEPSNGARQWRALPT